MLKKHEFDLLNLFLTDKTSARLSQRGLAARLSRSVGAVSGDLAALLARGEIQSGQNGYEVTAAGAAAMEPYRVDNAVIMAAGMSKRFAPLSYEKPKGLLRVKGDILIEREIEQLQAAGIGDITLVVGYMKEKFFYLEEKYGVSIRVNEDYYKYNNTSTLMCVPDLLKNTYICSSDNYFPENVFERYVWHAYYSAVYADGETNEYCLSCAPSGRIRRVTVGGRDSWYMLGHVYFDRAFSGKFREILEREYPLPETKEMLWEDLYARHVKELDMEIRRYPDGSIFEFDSLDELRLFDPAYLNNADSRIMENICRVLCCEEKDIEEIKAIKAGLTNTSFSFRVGENKYVYRHPGAGTENYIDRKSEAFSMKVAARLGLDDTFLYMDEKEGWKISRFIEDVRELDYHNREQVATALSMMKKLHAENVRSDFDFLIWNKTEEFIERLKETGKLEIRDFDELYALMKTVKDAVTSDEYAALCLCHCDCYSPNFILDKTGKIYLIDWEYSGNDDPASDVGTFVCCSDYTFEEALNVIRVYLGREAEKKELGHYLGYIALASYYWYVWALYQEYRGNAVGDYLYLWYKNSKFYAKKSLECYEEEKNEK
ncbi:MAG: phosphotransferase [Clostridia bacterium]|nr:phosphotransferase [Clostridia bacterium]